MTSVIETSRGFGFDYLDGAPLGHEVLEATPAKRGDRLRELRHALGSICDDDHQKMRHAITSEYIQYYTLDSELGRRRDLVKTLYRANKKQLTGFLDWNSQQHGKLLGQLREDLPNFQEMGMASIERLFDADIINIGQAEDFQNSVDSLRPNNLQAIDGFSSAATKAIGLCSTVEDGKVIGLANLYMDRDLCAGPLHSLKHTVLHELVHGYGDDYSRGYEFRPRNRSGLLEEAVTEHVTSVALDDDPRPNIMTPESRGARAENMYRLERTFVDRLGRLAGISCVDMARAYFSAGSEHEEIVEVFNLVPINGLGDERGFLGIDADFVRSDGGSDKDQAIWDRQIKRLIDKVTDLNNASEADEPFAASDYDIWPTATMNSPA